MGPCVQVASKSPSYYRFGDGFSQLVMYTELLVGGIQKSQSKAKRGFVYCGCNEIDLRTPYSIAPKEMRGDSTEGREACWEMLPFGVDMAVALMSTRQPYLMT